MFTTIVVGIRQLLETMDLRSGQGGASTASSVAALSNAGMTAFSALCVDVVFNSLFRILPFSGFVTPRSAFSASDTSNFLSRSASCFFQDILVGHLILGT